MKLALIRRQFSPTGGAELYLQRLLAALSQSDHSVHLLTESWEEPLPGVTLHSLGKSGNRANRPVCFADAVDRHLATQRFDCVFSLERTRRQDVYRAGDGLHRSWLQRRRQFSPWWRRPFVGMGSFHRNMLRLEAETFNPNQTRFIIANSEMVRREILEQFHFPAEKIFLVRNGVDVQRFQKGNRATLRTRFRIAPDDFLLLFVGSGWERKGLKYLLQAMRTLTDSKVKLMVVGKGKIPRSTPANVIFAGAMNQVEDAYAAADLFTFLPIYEPSANVCFEALAAGLPVITSIYNGAAEMISSRGTVLENPADTNALLAAIQLWRSNPKPALTANLQQLSLARNVEETLRILELAASHPL